MCIVARPTRPAAGAHRRAAADGRRQLRSAHRRRRDPHVTDRPCEGERRGRRQVTTHLHFAFARVSLSTMEREMTTQCHLHAYGGRDIRCSAMAWTASIVRIIHGTCI
eukprot:SAG11_NODE_1099_length_5874_cov_17.109784_6_plen_108_part_00